MTVKVTAIHYSATDTVYALALAVAEGAASAGHQVRPQFPSRHSPPGERGVSRPEALIRVIYAADGNAYGAGSCRGQQGAVPAWPAARKVLLAPGSLRR